MCERDLPYPPAEPNSVDSPGADNQGTVPHFVELREPDLAPGGQLVPPVPYENTGFIGGKKVTSPGGTQGNQV